MSELVVVANRGPSTLFLDDAGKVRSRQAAGGLAPSLALALDGRDVTWVAVAMSDLERTAASEGFDGEIDVHLVAIPPEIQASAYRVISNGTLWFIHHGLYDRAYRPLFDRVFYEAWQGYREYNSAIADEVVRSADEQATVVVHDYHLCLLGSTLAASRPDLRTVHFSHTPFCTPEELAVLPTAIAAELIGGLCSFGSCGFHTSRWADRFVACARALGFDPPPVFVAPLGVDADHLWEVSASPGCIAATEQLRERLDGRKLLFRSDRVEPSKNLIRGFLAFEELLNEHEEWRDRVVFVARAYPSREDLAEYLAYRATTEQVVACVNERFSSLKHQPIVLDIEDDFEASLAALSCYDVLLVNPIRDGMNLVAKEGPIMNRGGGVLALSREAGAFAELGNAALPIDPFDIVGTASVLHQALLLGPDERQRRAAELSALASACRRARWLELVANEARPAVRPARR